MRVITLDRFIQAATPYERWRAPLDQRLRVSVLLSGVSILTSLLLLLALPPQPDAADSWFFLVLGGLFRSLLSLLQSAWPILLAINLVSAALYALLLVFTSGLRAGRPIWHWIAFIQIIVGAADGCILALQLAIIVINIALWVLAVLLVLGFFYGLAQSSG